MTVSSATAKESEEDTVSLTIEELLDREMIRDVLADYSVSRELGSDLSASVNAFHPEGTLQRTDGHVFHGRAEIADFFSGLAKRRAGGPEVYNHHWIFPCRFSFPSPGNAETVTYMFVLTERGLDQVVTYRDSLVKEDGRWFIKSRQIDIEYITADSRLDLPNLISRNRQSAPPAK
jgi:hypothetical protein